MGWKTSSDSQHRNGRADQRSRTILQRNGALVHVNGVQSALIADVPPADEADLRPYVWDLPHSGRRFAFRLLLSSGSQEASPNLYASPTEQQPSRWQTDPLRNPRVVHADREQSCVQCLVGTKPGR